MVLMQNLNSLELKKIVLIGASTGGPGQVQKILSSLQNLTDTTLIIAQHMANDFIQSYAKRVKETCNNPVYIAADDSNIQSGAIYIMHGEYEVKQRNGELYFSKKETTLAHYNPNIDLLFSSFLDHVSRYEILCIILTGIGSDGVSGCKILNQSGVRAITESANSAIVDGMPSRARESVKNIEVDEIDIIVQKVKEFCS